MSGYEKRRESFRASKGKYSASKRSAAVGAKRSVSEIKRIALSVVETKHRGNAFTDDLDVPNYYYLNGIAQGDGDTNREGSRVNMSSLEIRASCYPGIATSDINRGTMLIVLDRQCNGAAPTLGDIYDTASGTIDPTIALRNSKYLERFKVVYRDDFVVGFKSRQGGGGTWSSAGEKAVHMIHKYIDLTKVLKDKDRLIRYGSGVDTINAISTNSLYCIMFPSNQTDLSSGTDYAKYSVNCKLNFKDA